MQGLVLANHVGSVISTLVLTYAKGLDHNFKQSLPKLIIYTEIKYLCRHVLPIPPITTAVFAFKERNNIRMKRFAKKRIRRATNSFCTLPKFNTV